MAKTKTIVAQSDITAGQMEDFWRKVKDGTISGSCLDSFLRNPSRFNPISLTLVRATRILGSGKVLSTEQATKAWGLPKPGETLIRYSEEDLREAAEENKTGADWRLVYFSGQSLREQHAKRGDNPESQPCFYKSWDWWLKSKEDEWANRKPVPGYYLLDFRGRFGRTSWDRQNEEIVKLGSNFERTHEAVVTEAAMSFFMTTGERLLGDFYHWGPSETSNGLRVRVGCFDENGWCVGSYRNPGYVGSDSSLRVCLSRKFRS